MKKKNELQYAVLGLGIFGSTVAKTLSRYDCEVTVIDKDMDCVDRLVDVVTQSIQGDITDISLLRNAGLSECDIAIVAVGTHLEESILCILHLKELGVPYVIAKAKNKSYAQILMKIGADKVVRPEREIGTMIAKGLLNRNILGMIDIDDEYSVIEIQTPNAWIGCTLIDIDVRKKYGVNVLGVRNGDGKLDVTPSPNYQLSKNDHLLIISEEKKLKKLRILDL